MRNLDNACKTQTSHAKRRQLIRNPDNAYETQRVHTKLRKCIRNPDSACETQTTHTKLRQRIRNSDNVYETQTTHAKRRKRKRNPDNEYETQTTHTKLGQRMRNVDNANETQTKRSNRDLVSLFHASLEIPVERFLYELWFSPIEQQAVFRSLVYQENELNTMVGSIWNEPYRWCNGKRARLRCGRSGVRTPIGSNERLWNWYLLLLR